MGKFRSPRVVPRERVRSPKFESRRGKLLRDGCACAARVKLGMRNVRRVNLTDIGSWYRVELRVGDHLGRSEELVSRCVECDLAEPESLASLGGSAPGVVEGILSDVLDPENTPSNPEKELFEAKQVFMFSVLGKHLLTDMGKTIVRKYVHTTDAQSVWKDFQEHMKSSSKGASEKRRLTQYVTNTVLDDNYKGTTEQFVLHFNEHFRQLEEISEESEHFPPQIKLQLLQNTVRPINDLRIVETLDEFQFITTGYGRSSSLKYQTFYDLLINASIRYNRTKKANVAKRGHIYQTTFSQSYDNFIDQIPSETPIDDPYISITPSDEFYNINTNQSGPPMSARHKLQPRLLRSNPNNKLNTFPKKSARQKWTGPIYLPGHIYNS